MAFNRKDPAHLLALKTEVTADPAGIGYAATGGATQLLLDLLNLSANNTTNATVNRPTEEIDIPDIAAVINHGEYIALDEYEKVWITMFVNRPADEILKPYLPKLLQLFPSGSLTKTAMLALRSKVASRAEELFGVNTVITRDDWIQAREN